MNGLEEYYIIKNNRKMRFGYTTGSCAAAAAKGAARMLLGGKRQEQVDLLTPKGILLHLRLEDIVMEEQQVSCCVVKDAGDDPDTTDGLRIRASVTRCPEREFSVEGGPGVGRVTKPGLDQPVGEAAINHVPRSMILAALREACAAYGWEGGLRAVISVPGGEEAAAKTFNPRLGIVGGISILGTTGIVEPMSEVALVESIAVEMRQRYAMGARYLLVTPGNYGLEYLRKETSLPAETNIKCSNYVGETIDMAVSMGIRGILFVAHIGKFIKVAAGIMNTHSHSADGRMEILASNAVRAGCSLETAREILRMNTTEEALACLKEQGLLEAVMVQVMEKIQFYLDHRSYEKILLGAVVFSSELGYLGQTAQAETLMRYLTEQEKERTGERTI